MRTRLRIDKNKGKFFVLTGDTEQFEHTLDMVFVFSAFITVVGSWQIIAALILDNHGAKLKYLFFAPAYMAWYWQMNAITVATTFVPAIKGVLGFSAEGTWVSPERTKMGQGKKPAVEPASRRRLRDGTRSFPLRKLWQNGRHRRFRHSMSDPDPDRSFPLRRLWQNGRHRRFRHSLRSRWSPAVGAQLRRCCSCPDDGQATGASAGPITSASSATSVPRAFAIAVIRW